MLEVVAHRAAVMVGLAVAITTIPVHLAALLVVLVDLLAVVPALGRRSGVSPLTAAKEEPPAPPLPVAVVAVVVPFPAVPAGALVTLQVVRGAKDGEQEEEVSVRVLAETAVLAARVSSF